MPVNYIDPWEGRVPSLKDSTFSQTAPTEKQNSGIFGDLVDAVQQGAYQSAAGDAEAVGQISDSDTFKSIGKALAKGANSQTDTMTGDAKQALSQHIFKDDPDSFTGVAFDNGATNWRTWALQFGVLAGQVAGTMATGFGAGSVVKAGAKTAIKAFAKEAVTKEAQQLVAKNAVKEAIRNGALDDVRAALIAAPDKAAMNAVLNKATSRLGGIATTAVAGSMAAGMRAQQARDEYLGLDADTLNQNPEFQKAYWEIADNPENQGLDTATIHNAAKEMLAEKAATTAFFDKKALLSDIASGAYVPGVGGVIGRGAATASKMGRFGIGLAKEWATEAWQGGETQRAVNEAIKEWGDESRDPMANVVRTRWEEGTLGGVFGGMAKVVEGQHVAPSKPIVTVEKPALTGNSMLDGALAQSAANEQGRYADLAREVEITQRPEGVMRPIDNPVTGNPDEPAFLRSTTFNPTGRDLSTAADIDINSPVQQALIRSQRADASAEAQLAQALAGGDQGRTLYESTLNDEGLVPESRRLSSNGTINLGGTPGDGINSNYIPPILSDRPDQAATTSTDPVITELATDRQMVTIPEGGARNAGVMKATNSPVTGDPDEPAYLRQANISDELRAAAQGDTTQTPGGNVKSPSEAGVLSPRNKVVTGNPDEPAYLRQLSTLRVTKRGKPFSSEKEAQLASRPTETPIELPTGGFGVVDKAELEQAQANQAPTATVMNEGSKQPEASQVNHDSNEAPGSDVGNGFKAGPHKGEKYRVGTTNTTGAENGTPILEKRMPGGTAATFYVGKDGNLLDADNVVFNKESSKERVWRPASKEQTAEAASILDEMGKLDLNDPKRAELKVKLKALVLGETTSTIKPSMQAEASPIEQPSSNAGQLGQSAAPTATVTNDGTNQTAQPADQAAVTPSPEAVTAPVVAKESQPQPAMTQEEKEDSDIDNPQIIEHTTGKNKVIRGVVRKDLTVDEAKAIDPYTFKKDGGYFIREKYFDQLPPKPVENKAEPTTAESVPEPKASDGGMTVDQLKQLRTETINKINQQEADNRAVDDRLLSKKDKLDKAIAEAEPAKDQFADNKLFTSDMVAAARARLKSKLANLNSGLDPEIVIDGMTITGAYIESGLRTFSAYAKAMTEDFGDKVKPYLLSFWEGARHYPGLDTAGMTSAEESAKQHAALMREETESAAKPAEKTQQKSSQEANDKAGTERQILRDGIHSKMANGELISNNNTLKRVAAELLGISTSDLSTTQLKEAQEAYEVAAVRHRRDTIISTFNEGGSVKVAFDLAVADYEAQPNMDVRTAKSSDMQAYSTPTPMALLANIAAGAWSGKTVFEPTAGNGLLLLTADSKTTYANELDPDRADSLAWSGFNVTVKDATNNPLEGMIPEKVDSVVANPPFGKYRDEAGKPTKIEFIDSQGRAYAFGEIDHIIAKNALDALKDDGSATLILGAPKEAGDYTGNNKVFLNWLYSNYNVAHHIEADGGLYKGQGAGWPTQMIVVHGRAKDGTGKFAPFKGEIERLNSWDAIYDSFNKQGLLDTKGAVFSQTTGDGNVHEGYKPTAEPVTSERSDNQRPSGDAGRASSSRVGKSGRSTGNAGGRQSGAGSVTDGTFDSQPDISRDKLESPKSEPAANAGNPEPTEQSNDLGLSGKQPRDAVGDYQKKEISSSVKKVNDFQAEYQTASEGFNEGVLTPVNMASYTQTALASIQERHGSVDKFVASRLGYSSKKDLHKAFMGLQSDAVALAVDAIEKGRAIIIGDQTGVGKGRQAAGVIRYALQQGKTPIFITQKPNLFTDMYDDLADIGIKDFKPLIVNQENGFISKGDQTLFDLSAKERQAAINQIIKTGKLPAGYNALFLTYSQISSDNGGNKTTMLYRLASNAVMVMDESHTAAGQDSKLGLAFQGLVNEVGGLVYLSATYAKRPDNMLLYTRTDLGQAVENREALVSIISNGGLGMQTYIAGKLAEAGQMVRRERSFDGIEIKNRIIKDASGKVKRGFDQATAALRAIQDLSSAWRSYVDDVLAKKIQKESGMDTRIAGNQADTKVDVTLFSSVVHNYIAQLSLGLKAKETAKLAIEAIERGERPVIALENTMGSALQDYMERTGRRVGDSASDLTYGSLLKSVADGALAYTVKQAGSKKGIKTYVKIRDVHDPLIQSLYEQVMDAADAMTIDIPASPIDAIRHEIEKSGYSVAEITGRSLIVDYANKGEIKNRPAAEKNRRRIVDEFNSKKLDVLILNQAGSTGLSIHASERFADKSPRHMIVAQPSLDINTFLQMLGRVNRTGQVVTPSYSLAWLDLPSEKRPAAVLSRKMSSLNANTSGNTDSATSIDAVDILNPYGDQVVTNFVEANRELLEQYNPRLVKLPDGDEAAYFLGKLAVLPSDVAEQVIGQIEKDYNDLIAYLDATGQNELNISEVDLDAQPISQRIVSEGRKGAGVFSEPTYVTKVDVKAQGKAPRWDEVEEALKESSQSEFDDAVNRMKADNGFAERLQERLNKAQKEFDLRKAEGKTTKTEAEKVESLKQMISSHEAEKNNLEYLFSRRGMYHHGAVLRVRLPDADEAITGIVTGLSFENDGGNPAAKSKWRMKIMVADRVRTLPINLSQAESGIIEGGRQDNRYNLQAIFDRASAMPSREHRYIMTGNLVEAQNCSMEKGRIIPFTTADGRVIQGMLMPKKFDPEAGSIKEKAKVTSEQAFNWLVNTDDRNAASLGLRTPEGDVVLRRLFNGGFELEMPKAVSKGKKYWGNPSMVEIIGEQAVKGNGKLNIRLSKDDAMAVNKVMTNINPLTITNQVQIADYNKMTGKKVPTFSETNIKFSKVPLNAAEQAGKGMTKPEAELAAKEWLKQFKTDIGVKVARNQAEFNQMLEDMGQSAVNADEVANAAYIPESKTLLLNASAIQNPARLRQLMRHEILGHHGLEYVIGKGAVNDILQILKNGYNTSKAIRDAVDTVAANYADADVKTKIKEAFAHYAENRPVDQGPLGRLWDRVVSAVKSALVKAGFIRVNEAEKQLDSILKTIAENMRQGRSDNGPNGGPGNKAYFSKNKNGDTSAYGQAESLLKESGSSLVNWLKQQRGRGLGTLTDLQIDQIYRDITGGAINRYQKLRTKMESDRNDILLEAETKYEPMWEALPEKAKAALSQLMHDATMSRLHPDKSLEENSLYQEVKAKLAKARTEKTKAEYQAELDIIRDNYRSLSERYRLADKQSKALYATMRDLYAKQWATLRDAISQRIEDQLGEGGKALASQMRLRMEHALQHGPYFPLARFGDYVVKARKGDEYIREHFEKRKDAEAALKQYRGEGYNAVMTVKETRAGDQANAHALGMEVIEALDKAQAEGTAPAELKDTVWQAMLDMLPDASYAKHAIHRKRIKGASRDGHRAYLQSVYHFAHHVSKIRYGHQMKAELDGMKEQVQLAVQGEESNIKPDEAEIAQQVLNEMNLRHEMNMNPKGSALAGQLGNLGFMFYLGASPASAMVNLTQNVTVMLPQLAGKYGFVKAAKFMLQAMVDYMRHGVFQKGTKEAWVSLTRATNAAITADEKAMLNKLYKAGVLDLTQAHSIAARADTDQQNIKPGKQWARTGMRWAGALFHNAEVLNREVAALTAYRLMKEQQPGIASEVLKGDSAAIDQVAEMVYDGHGNYAASNRPRYMRGDVMKVLTQFKIYSQMMTYTLARNAVLAAKGDKTALKTLGVMFGTTWMMAGMMGMPTPVGLILYGLASLFDDDDDRTGEASFRLGLTEVFGAEVGELIAKGPVDAISGLNISGRTGLSDLWWRSPKEGTEGDDLTFHYVQQIAGPVLGIGVSAVRGMREFANGDIQRGVEAMSPKAVKDLAKAYRQATEGEQTRNGDSVIDDVGAWNVAMQAMGFSSAKMSQVYAARGYIKGKEKVIEDERSNLLADFFDAKRSGDEEAMRDVMERIKAFNSKHDRAETITGRTLMQSIKSRNRSMERTQAGVYLSKKREYLRGEGKFLEQ